MKERRWDLLGLGALAVIFFLSTTILSFGVPLVFNSPDENANAVFSLTMAHNHQLFIEEPLNFELRQILHPRSVVARLVSATGLLAPGSFLGLPLFYGLAITVLPEVLLRFLTPLLAVAALFAWRRIVETLFQSRRVAFLATLAVMFHPAFWYYSARSMMHNVPFVCLLIFAAYFLLIKKRPWTLIAAGISLGLAIWFRTVEALWIIPLVVGLLLAKRRAFGRNDLLIFGTTLVLTLLPMLHFNWQAYGDAWTTGYTFHQNLPGFATPETTTTAQSSLLHIDLRSVLKNSWRYAVQLFPWMSAAAIVGFLAVVGRSKRRLSPYAWVTVIVSLWLWFFYGSWNFHDNPDPTLVTIGTSYVRYWLPIFVLISPYVAEGMLWLAARVKFRFASRLVVATCAMALIGFNVRPVFFADDGLVTMRQNLFAYAATRETIIEETEENAIIIVDRADKFLWPERRVVTPLRSEETYAAMPAMITYAPLYYFGITFPESDLQYLNTEKLLALGLRIELVKTLGEESLYRFYALP